MDEHSFEGRVAVVTGAGRGIGRAYAAAARRPGASVVVNDLGGSMEGVGADAGVAVQRGGGDRGGRWSGRRRHQRRGHGRRAAGRSSMRPSSGSGGIDILINNAGIIRWAGLPDADGDNLASHLAVHVVGSFNTTRAAWPHMVEQGYGRIVMTTSTGLFGLPENLSYATAKGGGDRAHPQPRHRGRRPRHQGQSHRPPALSPGWPARAAEAGATARGPRRGCRPIWSPHGRLPGPRGLPGQRRDLRRRLRPVRPHLHRLAPRGTCTRRRSRRSRTWPSTGRPSTTSRGYYVPADLMAWSAAFMAHQFPSDGDPVAR